MAQKQKKSQAKKKPITRKPQPKAKTAKPAKKPARKTVAKSARKPIAKPARKAAAKLARKPISKPVRKTAAKPVRKHVARPMAKPAAKKQPAKKRSSLPALPPVGGLPGELHAAAMRVLDERQAEEIMSFNLAGRSSMADYLIIASGRAARQIAAIADYLREAFMKLGVRQVRIEGLPEANWVLVDAGDVVVHLFRPEVRHYYRLEDIWSEAQSSKK